MKKGKTILICIAIVIAFLIGFGLRSLLSVNEPEPTTEPEQVTESFEPVTPAPAASTSPDTPEFVIKPEVESDSETAAIQAPAADYSGGYTYYSSGGDTGGTSSDTTSGGDTGGTSSDTTSGGDTGGTSSDTTSGGDTGGDATPDAPIGGGDTLPEIPL